MDDDDDAEVENRHVVPAVEAVLVCDSDDDCPGDQLCNTPVHADAVHCQATRVS